MLFSKCKVDILDQINFNSLKEIEMSLLWPGLNPNRDKCYYLNRAYPMYYMSSKKIRENFGRAVPTTRTPHH